MASTFDAFEPEPPPDEKDLFGAAPPSMSKGVEKKDPGVLLFDDLKVGMHIKARCGCTGFVRSMSEIESDSRWLDITYTDCPCKGFRNVKLMYEMQMAFQSSDIYHGSVFSSVFPATAVPAPEWYPSLEKGPVIGSPKLAVLVKLPVFHDGEIQTVSFLIPSGLSNMNVYETSIMLRKVFSSLNPELHRLVEVEVVESSDFKGTLKKEVEKIVMGSRASLEQKNVLSLKEEIVLASIKLLASGGADRVISVSGEVPLSKGSAIDAVMEARKLSDTVKSMSVKMTCRTKDESSMFTVNQEGKIS